MAVARGNAIVPCNGKRTARVFLCLYREHLVALHGFVKKTRGTPDDDLAVALKRKKELVQ